MRTPDPHSCTDLDQGTIRHIAFTLQIDFDRHVIHGHADYTLAAPPSTTLDLDTRDLTIMSVRAGHRVLPWQLDAADPILGQRLRITDLAGSSSVQIEFQTAPAASALQWLAAGQTAGQEYPFLFSQCQAIHARSIFPCQDSPMVRFTYHATISVPAGLTVVMAAAPDGMRVEQASRHCMFIMPQPIPSYLFALAVGAIEGAEIGPRSRMYAEPALLAAAAREFAGVETMITTAEQLFGPYIWDRYDMLLMPPSFPYGGMENPRLTFLTPALVIGDRSRVNVVVHELAHSWSGNLVTNATWEDFWLNEGWTVYAEHRIL